MNKTEKPSNGTKYSEFIKFCIVGGIATLIDAIIFYTVKPFTNYSIALIIGYTYWARFAIKEFPKHKILFGIILFLTSFSSTHTLIESVTPIVKEREIRIVDPIKSFYDIQSVAHADMCDFQFFAHNYEESFF